MFEGQAQLGVAKLAADGSWLAKVPANIPVALQAIDNWGMAALPEPVWFSARGNESRVCGGCHEDRAKTTVIDPGITQAFAIGAQDARFASTRAQRVMATGDLTRTDLVTAGTTGTVGVEKLVGMAWNKTIQPIFDAKCVSCHDGVDRGDGANPTYTISTADGTQSVSWTFNLSGAKVPLMINGMDLAGEWSASYFSVAGPDMEAIEKGDLVVSSNFKVYMEPQNARGSIMIQKLNPTRVFPQPSAERAFTTSPHSAGNRYPELTTTEFLKLIMAADMGVNYYARENNPGLASY